MPETVTTKPNDDIKYLEGLIKDMASSFTDGFGNLKNGLNEVKDRQDQIEEAIAAYRDAIKRGGLPAPHPDTGMSAEESKELFYGYDLAKQGQRLTDKFLHPNYAIPEEKKTDLAKYFILMLRAASRDGKAYNEFQEKYGRYLTPEMKTAVGDTGNVFPVPDPLEEEILHYAREVSVILQDARIWPMTSEKFSVPRETASPTVYWGNTTQESEPTIEEVELTCYELSAYASVRNTTLADAVSDVVSWLTESLAEAQAYAIDDMGFNGDGTSSYAYCSGLLSAACGYSVVMASGYTNFSSLLDTDLSNMIAQLNGARKVGAKFYLHGQNIHYVRTLKDSNNRPIFLETIGSVVPGRIFGYPYKESTRMPSTSAANTAFINFTSMQKSFSVGRRLYSTALTVNPWLNWTTNRTAFKLYSRWAGAITLPNNAVRLLTAAT